MGSLADFVYLTACSQQPDGGIHVMRMRGRELEAVDFAPLASANYHVFSPDRRFLYSTCEVDAAGGEGAPKGGVASFAVGEDGRLAPINTQPSGGNANCHVTVDPAGRFLYAANYRSGNFAEFPLDNGRIGPYRQLVQHQGGGPNLPRQEGPHTHFAGFTPDGRFLCVIDLGNDAVHIYPFDPAKGIDAGRARANPVSAPGNGPRHLVFDASGTLAYVLTELGNTVVSCRYADGRLEPVAERSTLPNGVDVQTKAAAIRLSPDGRFLLATNRGHDSIAVFAVDGQGGLERVSVTPSGGESPRDIGFLPGGTMLAAANEFSDRVVLFGYDPKNGALAPTGQTLSMKRPLCVVAYPG